MSQCVSESWLRLGRCAWKATCLSFKKSEATEQKKWSLAWFQCSLNTTNGLQNLLVFKLRVLSIYGAPFKARSHTCNEVIKCTPWRQSTQGYLPELERLRRQLITHTGRQRGVKVSAGRAARRPWESVSPPSIGRPREIVLSISCSPETPYRSL